MTTLATTFEVGHHIILSVKHMTFALTLAATESAAAARRSLSFPFSFTLVKTEITVVRFLKLASHLSDPFTGKSAPAALVESVTQIAFNCCGAW